MSKLTVKTTVDSGLCTSCGICKSVCPVNSISYKRKFGMYYPEINSGTCIGCGKCIDVCAGISVDYSENGKKVSLSDAIAGKSIGVYCSWSKDDKLRHIGASGGVTMTIVRHLIECGEYDYAFCVSEYNYSYQVKTECYSAEDLKKAENASKSRYIPVSHENLIEFVKNNPDKKIIVIGVPCAISGFVKAEEKLNLIKENYLLIGLFCEGVFNYNVFDYFSSEKFCGDRKVASFHFKNKESGGWPGNMKFFFDDGSTEYVSANERYFAKGYFRSERCLYCIDKLNVKADISVGDNYTGEFTSSKGSNSLIIRTEKGNSCFKLCADFLEIRPSSMEKVLASQQAFQRKNNYCFSLKMGENPNVGINEEAEISDGSFEKVLSKLKSTRTFSENPKAFFDYLKKEKREEQIKKIILIPKRVINKIKRIIKNQK